MKLSEMQCTLNDAAMLLRKGICDENTATNCNRAAEALTVYQQHQAKTDSLVTALLAVAEAAENAVNELAHWHGWRCSTEPKYSGSDGFRICQGRLERARAALARLAEVRGTSEPANHGGYDGYQFNPENTPPAKMTAAEHNAFPQGRWTTKGAAQ